MFNIILLLILIFIVGPVLKIIVSIDVERQQLKTKAYQEAKELIKAALDDRKEAFISFYNDYI